MKIRAGLKLCGRNPTHMPTAMIAISGPMFGSRQQVEVAELLAVEEERAGADGDDAGGQPVEAVDQVDRLGHAEQPQHRDQRDPVVGQDDHAERTAGGSSTS